MPVPETAAEKEKIEALRVSHTSLQLASIGTVSDPMQCTLRPTR